MGDYSDDEVTENFWKQLDAVQESELRKQRQLLAHLEARGIKYTIVHDEIILEVPVSRLPGLTAFLQEQPVKKGW